LQHTSETLATYAISQSTFATFRCNTCNSQMTHLKHLQHALLTQCHPVAWMNGCSSLRSSTPPWRSAVARGARRCCTGAALLRFSNACSWPRLAPMGGGPVAATLMPLLARLQSSSDGRNFSIEAGPLQIGSHVRTGRTPAAKYSL
jgi:hypothetical protein